MPQPLSTREGNLFRQVVRNYEEKQYKRGLKAAEQILKKNPKHGDTMAMKALILNAQGKTEEAFALGKESLTIDMKSHICWHVYGLLYRSNKNFEEAIKAYRFALRLEPESSQIQRDLAVLQIQMRDYQGYVQSRLAMLQARPALRQSWTGLAIAHHLAGNLTDAENILKTFEDTLKTQPARSDLEHSEALLYHNMIIAETGDFQRALDHLESACKHNLDRLAYLEARARYLTELGNKEEASQAWRALLDRNPDHAEYYDALVEVSDLSAGDDLLSRKAIYDEYAVKFPRCDAAKRLPLDFLTGDEFKAAAKSYLAMVLDKGIPSTFANLKHLYADEFKKATLRDVVDEYLSTAAAEGDSSRGRGAAVFYLAQHYSYYRSRDLPRAMEYVDKAIEEDPENVNFAMTRARIWKYYGNPQKASEAMEHARELDTRDRYINTKAAKYQLRNNELDRALKTMGMFTKADTPGGPLADLLDMQSVWFLTEDGEANARLGNLGLALKRFHAVFNIFDIWQEDQFDFHGFSLRKGMIRAYIDMVRWEDHLRDHPFYTRVAVGAANAYLRIYEQQEEKAANGVNGTENGNANGDDALEKKKAAKKARKEAQRLERESAEKAAKQDPNKKGVKPDPDAQKKQDDDPLGAKLAATTEPLADAMRFISPMLQCSPKSIQAQTTAFEVLILRKKYLLALRCLKAALSLDAEDPKAHEQAIRLRHALNTDLATLPPKVTEVINAEFTEVSASADLAKLNQEYREKHKISPQHVLSSIRVQARLGEDRGKLAKDVVALLQLDDIKVEDAKDAQDVLRAWKSGEVDGFQKTAQQKWPESSVFA
ncbi:N-terminal acetyltransferase A, auxiliary subunit [Cryphonectria parasitica EP155]|uniref:N-terminal acetyltransferase A, auxiliary subunit n=1 Tax=Cryphonectria parasitica (strain ATCC 38755 / EP155) TaxID=660469 RepID=A0A9P5CQZ8_CRYP1|nr:N-terminal acetyltransferase A, auxiliary subunit [Cryphonectria parasitica EP155]KAF3766731.1 N-terminal acetyltransferase A, auxiliary subunit [Cryphonectria parasitica EP155]